MTYRDRPESPPPRRVSGEMACEPRVDALVASAPLGHTHGGGEADILPNLRVLTGGARYGNPTVQRVIGVK